MLTLHSSVYLITNSSTSIYTKATQFTIEAAIKLLEALGGNKDEFDFQLYPGESLCETVVDDAEDYLNEEQMTHLETLYGYSEERDYVAELILNDDIEYPEEDSEYMNYEWGLVVTRNGKPFNEFNEFFNSFSIEASYEY